MKVAFLGLGQMGRRMVRHLNASEVSVWNRSPAIVEELVRDGFRPVRDLAQGVAEADLVMTMLRDDQAVRAVGDKGLFGALHAGQVWVDLTTGSPQAAESFQSLAESAGAAFVAAPVLGTLGPAEMRKLTVLAGGTAAGMQLAAPYLERFGTVRTVASVRQALTLKLIVNTLLAYYVEAVSESLPLAEAAGLSRSEVLDTLAASSVAAPVLQGKTKRWQAADYRNPDFPIDLLGKDLALMTSTAEEAGWDLPGVRLMRDLFQEASAQAAHAAWDMSGIGEAVSQRATP